MFRIPFLWFLFIFGLFHLTLSRELCDFTDIECMTKGAQNVFKNVVNGVEGLLDPTDPLYLDEVKGQLPSFIYRLSNMTLFGMKHCQLTRLECNKEESTYRHDIHCLKLILHYYYDVKGFLGLAEVDGQGFTIVTLDDYYLTFSGKYGKFISEKDQKLRIFVQTHKIDMEPKGKVTFESKTPLQSDPERSDLAKAYIKKNWRDMEKILRSPTLELLLEKYINGVDTYLRSFPLEKLIPKDYKYD